MSKFIATGYLKSSRKVLFYHEKVLYETYHDRNITEKEAAEIIRLGQATEYKVPHL